MNNNSVLNIFQQMVSMGTNPMQIKQMILNNNPQLRVLENQISQSGMNPIDFAFQYAKQNNIPIEQNSMMSLINQMKNMIPK